MSDDVGLQRTPLLSRSQSWAAEFPVDLRPITLDADACLVKWPNGIVPSGATLGQVTATGRYGPYGGTTEEVQTVTEGGSGLTSFTLTFNGQTTSSLVAAATAAQVQAALVALSNIGAGNVAVTGSAGGPYTVTFQGTLANTNVAQMTATPTGGTGTVTVATATGGGTDAGTGGLETAVGHLASSRLVRAGFNVDAALYYKGRVYEDLLPSDGGFDPAARAEITKITYDRVGA
jgi:hypothetical protein